MRRYAITAVFIGTVAVGIATVTPAVAADDYPSRPVRVLVPYPAGGAADRVARDVAAPASNLTVQTALFKKLPYDLDRDFVPLSVLVQTPQVLLVNPVVPVMNALPYVATGKLKPLAVT